MDAHKDKSGFKLRASWRFVIERENGDKDDSGPKLNMIVDGGVDALFDCLFKAAGRPAVFNYVGVGSANAATTSDMISLTTEVARVSSNYVHSAGSKITEIEAVLPAGVGTGVINEAAMFNAPAGGTMFNRVQIGPYTKGVNDILRVYIDIEML